MPSENAFQSEQTAIETPRLTDHFVSKNSLIASLSLHFVSVSSFWGFKKTQIVNNLSKDEYIQIAPHSHTHKKKLTQKNKKYAPVFLAELTPQDQAESEIRYFWILPDLSILIVDFHTQSKNLVPYSKGKYFLMAMNVSTKNLKKRLKFEYNRIN